MSKGLIFYLDLSLLNVKIIGMLRTILLILLILWIITIIAGHTVTAYMHLFLIILVVVFIIDILG